MSDLRSLANPFQFTNLDVRTAIDELDNVWFCAKDVCSILEITWNGSTLENMPEDWITMLKLRTVTGEKDAVFINESGLFRLIMRSNKPKAVEFSNWVLGEVLPTLRKQGFFGIIDSKDRIAYSKQIVEIASRLTTTKDALLFQLLAAELRDLHNLIGRPMPDIVLLGKDYKQLDMFGGV